MEPRTPQKMMPYMPQYAPIYPQQYSMPERRNVRLVPAATTKYRRGVSAALRSTSWRAGAKKLRGYKKLVANKCRGIVKKVEPFYWERSPTDPHLYQKIPKAGWIRCIKPTAAGSFTISFVRKTAIPTMAKMPPNTDFFTKNATVMNEVLRGINAYRATPTGTGR